MWTLQPGLGLAASLLCGAAVASLTRVQIFRLSLLILLLKRFLWPIPELPSGSAASAVITEAGSDVNIERRG